MRENLKIITETNTTNISNGSNFKINESIEINSSDRPFVIDSISSRFGQVPYTTKVNYQDFQVYNSINSNEQPIYSLNQSFEYPSYEKEEEDDLVQYNLDITKVNDSF